jgi:transposase-like protein
MLGKKQRKDDTTMNQDNVIAFKKPEIEDPISDILREGARKLLATALEAEIEGFLERYKGVTDAKGCQRVVRNGHGEEREIQTGLGQIPVQVPRARDRAAPSPEERIRFSSAIVPPYLRRTKSIETLLPWLYLKGISTGDFNEALAALLGKEAPGLSPATIGRLKAVWQEEFRQWQQRDLSGKRYVYFWADGIYCNVRMDDRQCLLVIIGATEDGHKELLALEGGIRESEQSWLELLLDLKRRGLQTPPQLGLGDGALGFWKALAQAYDTTRRQRCWVPKTVNVLNKSPKSLQAKAKAKLHQIWMAENKEEAEKNFDHFIQTHEAKYPQATACLGKDRDALLTFYDFPAEHWRHIRTTNPIESTFGTVRLRPAKVRNCFSALTVLTMAFQLCRWAQKKWIRLQHPERLGQLINGVKFMNGIIEQQIAA